MVLGVIIGVILLLLLIALVVLLGLIEWGGVDTDKWFGGEKTKDSAPSAEDTKIVSKPIVKTAEKRKIAKKAPGKAKKKGAKK
jgi:hypothetical protein